MKTAGSIFQSSILLEKKLDCSCFLSCWKGFVFPSQPRVSANSTLA